MRTSVQSNAQYVSDHIVFALGLIISMISYCVLLAGPENLANRLQ